MYFCYQKKQVPFFRVIFFFFAAMKTSLIEIKQHEIIKNFIKLKLCVDSYYLFADILYRFLGEERTIALFVENLVLVCLTVILIRNIKFLYKINFKYLVNGASFLLSIYILYISYQTHPYFPVAYFYFICIPIGLFLVNSMKRSLLYSLVLLIVIFLAFYWGDFNSFPLYTIHTKNLNTIEYVRIVNYYIPILFTFIFLFFDIYYLVEYNKASLEIVQKETTAVSKKQKSTKKDNLDLLF